MILGSRLEALRLLVEPRTPPRWWARLAVWEALVWASLVVVCGLLVLSGLFIWRGAL